MNWNDIRQRLVDTRTVLNDDGDHVMVVLRYADTESNTALTQRVEVSRDDVLGEPWIVFIADVCPANAINPHRALVHNGTLAVGSIYIDENYYFVRHTTPCSTLTEAQLATFIDLLAHEATRLRARRPLMTAAPTDVFDAYAD